MIEGLVWEWCLRLPSIQSSANGLSAPRTPNRSHLHDHKQQGRWICNLLTYDLVAIFRC